MVYPEAYRNRKENFYLRPATSEIFRGKIIRDTRRRDEILKSLPSTLDSIRQDPLYMREIATLLPGQTKAIKGYQFTRVNDQVLYSRTGSYNVRLNSHEWKPFSFSGIETDRNTYASIRNKNRVNAEPTPRFRYNRTENPRYTSRYEQLRDQIFNEESSKYPRRGFTWFDSNSGLNLFKGSAGDTRTFYLDKRDSKYYPLSQRNLSLDSENRTPHILNETGDTRMMKFLAPEGGITPPRSYAKDFSKLYPRDDSKVPGELGKLRFGKGTISITPSEDTANQYLFPGEKGAMSFNISEAGVTIHDNDNHGPVSPGYLFWNHDTAQTFSKELGIVLKPVFYEGTRKLRGIEIVFTKEGEFDINGTRYSVTKDGVSPQWLPNKPHVGAAQKPRAIPPAPGDIIEPQNPTPSVQPVSPQPSQSDITRLNKLLNKITRGKNLTANQNQLKMILERLSDEKIIDVFKAIPNNNKRLLILANLSNDRLQNIVKMLPEDIRNEINNFISSARN